MPYQCLLQLQTEQNSVANLLEGLEDVSLQVPVSDHRGELCLIEAQHSLAPILVQGELAFSRHAPHESRHIGLQGVGDLQVGGVNTKAVIYAQVPELQ